MLHPRDAEKNAEAILMAEIQKPTRRSRIDTDQIGSRLMDDGEILGDLFLRPILKTLCIWCKRPIGYPFDKKFLFPLEEELRTDNNTFTHPQTVMEEESESRVLTGQGQKNGCAKNKNMKNC
jgi:hypothetical protein